MRRRFEKTNTIYYGTTGAEAQPQSWQSPPSPEPVSRKAPDKNVGTIEGDVHVPVLQAICIAALLSVFGTAIMVGAVLGLRWPWWLVPLALVLIWSGLGGALAWQNVGKRQQLWQQELNEHRDINGDGYIGPPPEKPTLDVWIHEDNGHGAQSRPFDFGLEPDMAAAFCQQVIRDGDLTEGTWGKTWLNGQRVFASVNDYRQLRNGLEQAGLIAAKNPLAKSQGYDLTKAGRAVFNRTIEKHSPNSNG